MNSQSLYRYDSSSEAGTERLAQALAEYLLPGSVLALEGDLGAGKTRFTQAFAKAIGVSDIVNSPTFTIIKEYEGSSFPLYHMDVYRINIEEAWELGLDEYFDGQGITIVEWASRIEEALPESRLGLLIKTTGTESREFVLQPFGERYEFTCETMKGNGILR